MKKMLLAVALVAALLPLSALAQTSKTHPSAIGPFAGAKAPSQESFCNPNCLFYAGDWDPNASIGWVAFWNGDFNDGGTVIGATNYVPFVVGAGKTWHVSGLFTNNIFLNIATGGNNFKLDPPQAYWSVSTGVSAGNGGTVVAGGALAGAKATTTGRSYSGVYFENTVTVKTPGLTLGPGTYWLAVAGECTDSSCEEIAYNTDVDLAGDNRVGAAEPACQSYQTSTYFGISYVNDDNQGYAKNISCRMSAGVIGKD